MTKVRCYHSHTPMLIGSVEINGGSCIMPHVSDCDVYVGLDRSMKNHKQLYPWNPGNAFLYEIRNMGVPKAENRWDRMIEWLAKELSAGSSVHVGCIGGHGRTGMVLVALLSVMEQRKDAIQYVRKNYCKSAVETKEQVDWLVQRYGVAKAKPRYTERDLRGPSQTFTSIPSTVVPFRGRVNTEDVVDADFMNEFWPTYDD